MARKKRGGETPDAQGASPPVAAPKRPKRARGPGPEPMQTPLFEISPDFETAIAEAAAVVAQAAVELDTAAEAEAAVEAEPVPGPITDEAREAFNDGFTAIVLKAVGRLGPRAARAATERLREALMRWAAMQPVEIREPCFGYVLDVGPTLRRANRTRAGLELTLATFGEVAEEALGSARAEALREGALDLVDALAAVLVDGGDPVQTAIVTEALRAELDSQMRRNLR